MTTAATYDRAMQVADKITKRVICISNSLLNTPTQGDPLSSEIRKRVCASLRHHMENCEG